MTEKNNSIITEIDLFLGEKGISVWNDVDIFGEVMIEEIPLRDTLKGISDLPFHETETPSIEIKEGLIPKNKRSIISFGTKKDERKIVDVFILSSAFSYFSEEVNSFEDKMIEDLSYGRTEFFDFRVKFVHLGFQNVLKIFKKRKSDKVILLFLSDVSEGEYKNSLISIENHSEFKRQNFYYFYQNDKNLKFFENRIDFFFNFVKYEIQK